jgi:hypothetical protein
MMATYSWLRDRWCPARKVRVERAGKGKSSVVVVDEVVASAGKGERAPDGWTRVRSLVLRLRAPDSLRCDRPPVVFDQIGYGGRYATGPTFPRVSAPQARPASRSLKAYPTKHAPCAGACVTSSAAEAMAAAPRRVLSLISSSRTTSKMTSTRPRLRQPSPLA